MLGGEARVSLPSMTTGGMKGSGRAAATVRPAPSTAFDPPRQREWHVARPRLTSVLDRIDEPVILVSAPAGYGKSTLLGQWARVDPRRGRWLRLEDGAELNGIVRSVAAALTRIIPFDMGPLLRATRDGGPGASLPVDAGRLLDALDGAVPFLLVIDGVHLIPEGPAMGFITSLASRVPRASTLVLAGRRGLGGTFARLRASGIAAEITAPELAMSPAEVGAALRLLVSGLGDDDVGAVASATRGWPAMVHLAAGALRGRSAAGDMTESLAADLGVAGYVREVVIGSHGRELRLLLRRLAVVDRISPDLAALLAGDAAAGERVRDLAALGIPLGGRDPSGEWVRLHPLLRAVLRGDLHREDPALERGLHLLASRWHARRGLADEAFTHALAAGDRDCAAMHYTTRLMSHLAAGHRERGRERRSAFTITDAVRDPGLAVAMAWHDAAEGLLDAGKFIALAEAADPGDQVCRSDFASAASGIAGWRAMYGSAGLDDMAANAQAFDAAEPIESPVRAVARTLVGVAAMLGGRLDEAGEPLRDAQVLLPPGRPVDEQLILALLAFRALHLGRLEAARATAALAADAGTTAQGGTQAAALTCAVSAAILAETGDRRAARSQLGAARARARVTAPSPWLRVMVKLSCARAARVLGDVHAAADDLARVRAILAEWPGAPLLEGICAGEARSAAPEESAAREGTSPSGPSPATAELSATELRVLAMLPSSRSLREIGAIMFVSRNTVKTHVSAIYRALGVSTREDAVARARLLGLID